MTERIIKLNDYDELREQLLYPSSVIELISFLRILLLQSTSGHFSQLVLTFFFQKIPLAAYLLITKMLTEEG